MSTMKTQSTTEAVFRYCIIKGVLRISYNIPLVVMQCITLIRHYHFPTVCHNVAAHLFRRPVGCQTAATVTASKI